MDKDQQLTTVKNSLTEFSRDGSLSQPPVPPVIRSDYNAVRFDEDSIDVIKYLRLAVRQWKVIAAFTFLGIVAAIWYTRSQTPIYRARTSLEIQGSGNPSLKGTDSSFVSSTDIQTQARLFQSASIRKRVLAKLQPRQQPIPSSEPEANSAVAPENETPAPEKPPSKVSIWPTIKGLFLPRGPISPLAMAAGTLKVTPVRESRIIEITCSSIDPSVAARFVNTLVDEYLAQRMEDRWDVYSSTGQWLTRAQEELKQKVEASEQRLQQYAKESGLLFISDNQSVAEDKLKQLQDELSKAQAERIQKEARYNLTISSTPESLPEVLDNGPLTQYQVRLSELRRQMAELTSSLTPAHPKVMRVQAQISELESTLVSERRNVVKRLKNEYQSALERERLLERNYGAQTGVVSQQAEKTIQYSLLKKDVDTNRELYETALKSGKEASINSALQSSNVRVVDVARPALLPSSPNVLLNLLAGVFLGCVSGLAFVFGRNYLNRSIQRPGETMFYLNVPELGVIPCSSAESRQPLAERVQGLIRSSNGSAAGKRSLPLTRKSQGVELATWVNRPSLLAESFRAALTSIMFLREEDNPSRVLAVSSSMPSEGKTTVVSNLGVTLAEFNRRVLIIDADMRKPKLHKIFNVSCNWGLSDLLQERTLISDYPKETLVRKTDIPNLSLLVSGQSAANIPSILHSSRMTELLERVKRDFDVVLIDSPPMLELADARVIGRLADGVVFVIRAGKTSQDAAASAIRRFQEDGTRVLGTILNDWNPKDAVYGHNYAHGYSYHYASK